MSLINQLSYGAPPSCPLFWIDQSSTSTMCCSTPSLSTWSSPIAKFANDGSGWILMLCQFEKRPKIGAVPTSDHYFRITFNMVKSWFTPFLALRVEKVPGTIWDHPCGAGWTSPCPVALTRGIDIRAIAKSQPNFFEKDGKSITMKSGMLWPSMIFWGLLYDLLVSLSITLFGTQDKPSLVQIWRKNAIWVWLAHRSRTVNLACSKEKSLSLYGFWWECKCN